MRQARTDCRSRLLTLMLRAAATPSLSRTSSLLRSTTRCASRRGGREQMLKAVSYLEDGLAQWRSLEDLVEQSRTLYVIGLTYLEIGNQEEALKYASEALIVARMSGDSKVQGRALDALGDVENY